MKVHTMKSVADTGTAIIGEVESAASGALESGWTVSFVRIPWPPSVARWL